MPDLAPEPDWLMTWRHEPLSSQAALKEFKRSAPVASHEMVGRWKGAELPTGHPIDGLLTAFGWWGKRVDDSEHVDPLIFQGKDDLVAINPAHLPLEMLTHCQKLIRSRAAQAVFRTGMKLITAREAGARVRQIEFAGQCSAAIVYDDLPIIDHFRRIDSNRLLGFMDMRQFSKPYFFTLTHAMDV